MEKCDYELQALDGERGQLQYPIASRVVVKQHWDDRGASFVAELQKFRITVSTTTWNFMRE
jgi:hypothetical protein